MGLKVIDVVVWYTNNDNVLMMFYHNTQKVVKHQKRGSGAEKKSAGKVPSIRRFRGARRRSQNVEEGPKQRFDGSPRDSQNFSNAEYMQSCVTTIEPKSTAFWSHAKRPQNHVFS